MSDVWYCLLCLEVTEGETRPLPHDAVLVLQQTDEVVHDVVTGVAGTTEGDGGHSTHIRILVIQQLNQSIHHSWVLELSCVGGRKREAGKGV